MYCLRLEYYFIFHISKFCNFTTIHVLQKILKAYCTAEVSNCGVTQTHSNKETPLESLHNKHHCASYHLGTNTRGTRVLVPHSSTLSFQMTYLGRCSLDICHSLCLDTCLVNSTLGI
jgi:hypothetical protein